MSYIELNKEYIHYLIEIINTTKIFDGNCKILLGRAIEVLTKIIKKNHNKIYSFFLEKDNKNIFPKIKLLEFSFQIKELQYISSELLKIFYSFYKGKELITNEYDLEEQITPKIKNAFNIFSFIFNDHYLMVKEREIKKEDIYLLEVFEKIILDNNIQLEVKVNILSLYSRMDQYFIGQMNCHEIPINFIEFLFKFREDYVEFIYIGLEVLLLFTEVKTIVLSSSLKTYLFQYLEKNIKNNNLMIEKSDIDEYLGKNKYDESKLELTFDNIKENFKKKYYEELLNKVFTEEEIDIKLLKFPVFREKYGKNMELIWKLL